MSSVLAWSTQQPLFSQTVQRQEVHINKCRSASANLLYHIEMSSSDKSASAIHESSVYTSCVTSTPLFTIKYLYTKQIRTNAGVGTVCHEDLDKYKDNNNGIDKN